jgi:hypothetical protein
MQTAEALTYNANLHTEEDPFERTIRIWKERDVLNTMSREDREKEYERAVTELEDYFNYYLDSIDYSQDTEEVREHMNSEAMRNYKKVKFKSALQEEIFTPQEHEDFLSKATEHYKLRVANLQLIQP